MTLTKKRVIMKKLSVAILLLAFLVGCKKSDWRDPYTGSFDFMCVKSTMVSTANGWEERWIDTSYLTTSVVKVNPDRIKIQFGLGTIGVNLESDDTLTMTVEPILKESGKLEFPSAEYPQGGHNHIDGEYITTDTIKLNIHYGYLIGGYDKYAIIGKRVH